MLQRFNINVAIYNWVSLCRSNHLVVFRSRHYMDRTRSNYIRSYNQMTHGNIKTHRQDVIFRKRKEGMKKLLNQMSSKENVYNLDENGCSKILYHVSFNRNGISLDRHLHRDTENILDFDLSITEKNLLHLLNHSVKLIGNEHNVFWKLFFSSLVEVCTKISSYNKLTGHAHIFSLDDNFPKLIQLDHETQQRISKIVIRHLEQLKSDIILQIVQLMGDGILLKDADVITRIEKRLLLNNWNEEPKTYMAIIESLSKFKDLDYELFTKCNFETCSDFVPTVLKYVISKLLHVVRDGNKWTASSHISSMMTELNTELNRYELITNTHHSLINQLIFRIFKLSKGGMYKDFSLEFKPVISGMSHYIKNNIHLFPELSKELFIDWNNINSRMLQKKLISDDILQVIKKSYSLNRTSCGVKAMRRLSLELTNSTGYKASSSDGRVGRSRRANRSNILDTLNCFYHVEMNTDKQLLPSIKQSGGEAPHKAFITYTLNRFRSELRHLDLYEISAALRVLSTLFPCHGVTAATVDHVIDLFDKGGKLSHAPLSTAIQLLESAFRLQKDKDESKFLDLIIIHTHIVFRNQSGCGIPDIISILQSFHQNQHQISFNFAETVVSILRSLINSQQSSITTKVPSVRMDIQRLTNSSTMGVGSTANTTTTVTYSDIMKLYRSLSTIVTSTWIPCISINDIDVDLCDLYIRSIEESSLADMIDILDIYHHIGSELTSRTTAIQAVCARLNHLLLTSQVHSKKDLLNMICKYSEYSMPHNLLFRKSVNVLGESLSSLSPALVVTVMHMYTEQKLISHRLFGKVSLDVSNRILQFDFNGLCQLVEVYITAADLDNEWSNSNLHFDFMKKLILELQQRFLLASDDIGGLSVMDIPKLISVTIQSKTSLQSQECDALLSHICKKLADLPDNILLETVMSIDVKDLPQWMYIVSSYRRDQEPDRTSSRKGDNSQKISSPGETSFTTDTVLVMDNLSKLYSIAANELLAYIHLFDNESLNHILQMVSSISSIALLNRSRQNTLAMSVLNNEEVYLISDYGDIMEFIGLWVLKHTYGAPAGSYTWRRGGHFNTDDTSRSSDMFSTYLSLFGSFSAYVRERFIGGETSGVNTTICNPLDRSPAANIVGKRFVNQQLFTQLLKCMSNDNNDDNGSQHSPIRYVSLGEQKSLSRYIRSISTVWPDILHIFACNGVNVNGILSEESSGLEKLIPVMELSGIETPLQEFILNEMDLSSKPQSL